jgi:hypothetical protein
VYKIKFLLDGLAVKILIEAANSIEALEIFEKKLPGGAWLDIHLLETLPGIEAIPCGH